MIVLKFGGNSIRYAFNKAVDMTLKLSNDWEVVIVVSALKDVTDLLLRYTETKEEKYITKALALHRKLKEDHGLKTDLHPYEKKLLSASPSHFHSFGAWKSYILSFGELLSALLFAEAVRGVVVPPWDIFETTLDSEDGEVILKRTKKNINVIKELSEEGVIPVVPGFVGSFRGSRCTFGRGGGDYTAVVLGALLGWKAIIMSDVPGIFTADPKLVPRATIIPYLSYKELDIASSLGLKAMQDKAAKLILEQRVDVYFGRTKDMLIGTHVSSRRSGLPIIVTGNGSVGIVNSKPVLPYDIIKEGKDFILYSVPDDVKRATRTAYNCIFGNEMT